MKGRSGEANFYFFRRDMMTTHRTYRSLRAFCLSLFKVRSTNAKIIIFINVLHCLFCVDFVHCRLCFVFFASL